MRPTTRRRTRRAIDALVALALLVVLFGATGSVRAAPSVLFADIGAAVDFPARIVFTLEAEASAPIQRVELRYRPLLGRVTFVARPTVAPGTRVAIRYERDMRVNYLPPGIELVYHWRLEFPDGSSVESPEQRLSYFDDRYRWDGRARGAVELYSAVDDARYTETALGVAERSVRSFSERFAVRLEGPLRIVLYPSPEALQSALPVQSEEWIGGIAIPEYRLVLAGVAPGSGAREELERILSHEVLHLVIAQATDNPFTVPPAWLDEGLATAFQSADDPRLDVVLGRAVRDGALPSLRALRTSFGTDPDRALLGYAASRSVVEYLLATYGEDGVRRLLAAYREGVSDDEALARSLGVTLETLEREWRAWLAQRSRASVPASHPEALALGFATLVGLRALRVGRRRSRARQPQSVSSRLRRR
ncbi:MAG: peptidase MA family metallohydrolase [Thermomicrobium sp.]|nr:peptidase MA family metallohydrolase [Thermomicrobium sp.]